MPVRLVLVELVALVCFFCPRVSLHADIGTVDAESGPLLKEVGLALGTPAGFNLVLGEWGTHALPLLGRLSGMYYGDGLKGFQAEVGWAFQRGATFSQAVSAGLVTFQTKRNSEIDQWTGLGPFYDLNWHGLEAQLGLSFGSGTTLNTLGVLSNYNPVQIMFQVGYSFLW